MQRTPPAGACLKAVFSPAQPARSKACTFFVSQRHGFPARQMNDIVSPVADIETKPPEQTVWTTRKTGSNAWTAPASATAPRFPILLPLSHTSAIVALALWLLHPSRVPNTQSGSFKKKILRTLTERGSREPGTLDPEPVMSWDLLPARIVPSPSQTLKTESAWRKRNTMHGARTSKERSPH